VRLSRRPELVRRRDAVATLADLGEHDAARQFLVTTEAAHAEVSGLAQLCLLAARLHVDLAQCEVAAARATAEQVGLNAISPLLHAPALRADLLRLHVLTGWTGPAYEMVAERLAQSSDSAVSAVRGLQGLIDGHYSRAVAHLRSAVVAQRASPAERWELLADLVEAYLASGDRSAAAAVVAAEKLGDPRSLAAIAARDRVRALLAPPLEARDAFAKALDVAGPPLPLAYRARAGLAYARRLEQLGFGADADAQRGEAADLFGQQGLVGWQTRRSARPSRGSSPATSHFLDELSDAEQRVVRLLVQGRQNRRIAEELFVSLRTVEKLLTSIYRKAGVASKSALLAKLESLDE